MALINLQIREFRCISHAELDLDRRCTLITGENAAGKTSILEAIHVLSCGRSFRSSRLELLLRNNSELFLVSGKVTASERTEDIGVRWSPSGKEIRASGMNVSGFAELAAKLPVQVIDPGAHKLIEEGPQRRRRFIDWGLFHVEPSFIGLWRNYQRALSQRNAALKAREPTTLVQIWDEQLAEAGEAIGRLRSLYVSALEHCFGEIAAELLGKTATLTLQQGWDENIGLSRSLFVALDKDIRNKSTTVGPHRADLEICVEGGLAKERISRGQQKLLACALMLAQLRHRVDLGKEPASLLLDDPAAELDVDNLGKLLSAINKIPAQLVVTAIDSATIEQVAPHRRFHVKQGIVTPVL